MANHQQQPLTSKQAKKKTRMFIISLLVCLIALSCLSILGKYHYRSYLSRGGGFCHPR